MTSLDPIAHHVVGWLWEASWQAAVVAGAVLLVQRLFGRHLSAGWRYRLWALVAIRLMLPVLPGSALSIYNLVQLQERPAPQPALVFIEPTPVFIEPTRFFVEPARGGSKAASGRFDTAQVQPPSAVAAWSMDWRGALFLVWLAGAAVVAGTVLKAQVRFQRRIARDLPLADPMLLQLVSQCKQELGIRRALTIVCTDAVASPAVTGFLRPKLLLPNRLIGLLDASEIRLVLLHELMHLKCLDMALEWVMALFKAVHWFNPVVWLAAGWCRADRELARDAMVLHAARPEEEQQYGRTILKLVEQFGYSKAAPGVLVLLDDTTPLKRRIRMIADFRRNVSGGAVLAIGLMLVVGCTTLTGRQATAPQKNAPSCEADTTAKVVAAKGAADDANAVFVSDGVVDVTAQVKSLVSRGTRSIAVGNQMAGRDPAFGVGKSLRVEFLLDGHKQTAETLEGNTLDLPDGSEVVKAVYGPRETLLDVTAKVKSLVSGGTRSIRVSNEIAGDHPAPGRVMRLRVEFLLNGQKQVAEALEGNTVDLPAGSEVVKAVYGPSAVVNAVYRPAEPTLDVTAKVKSLVSGGTRSIPVSNEMAGDDPAPGMVKRLRVEFLLDGRKQTAEALEYETLDLPAGSEVVKAVYGPAETTVDMTGNVKSLVSGGTRRIPPGTGTTLDVTAKVKSLVSGGTRSIPVSNEMAGTDPAFGSVKRLRVEFLLDGRKQTAEALEGKALDLPAGSEVVKAVYGAAETTLDMTGNVRSPVSGSTRRIPAGTGTTLDVTAKVKSLVSGGTRSIPVSNEMAGTDPAFGSVKRLRVEFILNGQRQTVQATEFKRTLDLPAGIDVVKALYGDLPALPNSPSWLDVTAKVKSLVAGGTRAIHAESEIAGEDPAPNTVKQLRIRFRLNGEQKTSEVSEGERLEVPAEAEVIEAVYGDLRPPDANPDYSPPRSWSGLATLRSTAT